jgi:hypothetical protein
MCNFCSVTMDQEAIRAPFRVINRYVGNLPPMPGVFPDYPAPGDPQPGCSARERYFCPKGLPVLGLMK